MFYKRIILVPMRIADPRQHKAAKPIFSDGDILDNLSARSTSFSRDDLVRSETRMSRKSYKPEWKPFRPFLDGGWTVCSELVVYM